MNPKVIGGVGEKCSNDGTQYYQQDRIYDNKIALSVTTAFNPYYLTGEKMDKLKIRKLTPKECWRLRGFSDEDFEKARVHNSDSQLYKQAGNSICVPCLQAILEELLNGEIQRTGL